MSSAFPLPLKADNQAIRQNCSLKFYTMYPPLCRGYIPTLSFKTGGYEHIYKQLFHQQSQNNYIKAHLFQLLHLHIPVNMAVVKNENSIILVCDGDADK